MVFPQILKSGCFFPLRISLLNTKNPLTDGVLFPVPVQMFSCKFTEKKTPSENSLSLNQEV